jgi:hypothetical protein
VGLKNEKTGRKRVKGKDFYYYHLHPGSLDIMLEIVDRRNKLEESGWAYINELYGFEYSEEECDFLYGY